MALICPEHHFRANEHGTAASFRSCYDTDYSRTVLSKTSALRSLSRSLISILNPLIATALYAFAGLNGVVAADVGSFIIAFTALLFLFHFKEQEREKRKRLSSCKEGLGFLKRNPMILTLLLFLSGINFVSSAFDAVLPGFVLPNPKGSQAVLGIVTSCSGAAMIVGSLIVSALPKPKDRVKLSI